jgi:hypothetical protein
MELTGTVVKDGYYNSMQKSNPRCFHPRYFHLPVLYYQVQGNKHNYSNLNINDN